MCRYLGHHAFTFQKTLDFLQKKNEITYLRSDHLSESRIVSNASLLAIKTYRMRCTPLDEINREDDGGILDGWKLEGVLLVLRHGDRGPMSHIRSVPYLNCGLNDDNLLKRLFFFDILYKNFISKEEEGLN